MDAHPRGSLDPWCKDGSECKPEWDAKKMGHEHPLGFMAELLQQWPTGASTVDLEHEERHLRFIQIVAGYPEIGRGMYPLDWPTHPMSVKALQLSLFLDNLKVPIDIIKSPSIKAYSVRSAILALDARRYKYGNKSVLTEIELLPLHKECLTLLFKGIRAYEIQSNTYEADERYKELLPSHEETLFLNSLHSSEKERMDKWWLKAKKWSSDIKLDPYESGEIVNKEHTHTLKLESIQDWIEEWSAREEDNYPFVDDSRHNLLIGASVMLECLFAKLRQYVISAYRPGSIIIDGGGRIEFFTKKNSVEEDVKKVIEQSLLISPKLHPFQHIIKNTLIEFGKGRIGTPQFPSIEWDEDEKDNTRRTPKKTAYVRFIGKKRVIEFYPSVRYNVNHLYVKKEERYKSPDCLLCTPRQLSEITQFKHQKVCFLHALMFNIGQAQQRRDYSVRKSGGKIYREKLDSKGKKITLNLGFHSCAMLDLNALGTMFGTPLSETPELMEKILHFHQPPQSQTYTPKKHSDNLVIQDIVRDNLLQHNLRGPLEHIDDFEYSKGLERYEFRTREQLSVVRTRKSFRFNTKWWSSIAKIIDTKSEYFAEIGAWVAAGDDLLLVRRGVIGEGKDILRKRLVDLDKLLKDEFPNSAIKFSFCAGLTKRKKTVDEKSSNEKIPVMIRRAMCLEKLAKCNWKTRADKNNRIDLISKYDTNVGDTERKKFDMRYEWEQKDGPVYSIPSVREGVPTEEESMIYHSTFKGEEE